MPHHRLRKLPNIGPRLKRATAAREAAADTRWSVEDPVPAGLANGFPRASALSGLPGAPQSNTPPTTQRGTRRRSSALPRQSACRLLGRRPHRTPNACKGAARSGAGIRAMRRRLLVRRRATRFCSSSSSGAISLVVRLGLCGCGTGSQFRWGTDRSNPGAGVPKRVGRPIAWRRSYPRLALRPAFPPTGLLLRSTIDNAPASADAGKCKPPR